jgi:hypothetical protein
MEYYSNRQWQTNLFVYVYAAQLFRCFRSNPCTLDTSIIFCLQYPIYNVQTEMISIIFLTQHAAIIWLRFFKRYYMASFSHFPVHIMPVPSPSRHSLTDGIFLRIFSGSDPDMHLHDVYVYTNTESSHGSQLNPPQILVTVLIILSPICALLNKFGGLLVVT